VPCRYWSLATSEAIDENEEEEDDESEEEDEEEEEELYVALAGKNNEREVVKFVEEGIQLKEQLIQWEYYEVLKRQFDRKPGKKAKYHLWYHGPGARCWCNYPLYSPEDECRTCLIEW
jgi:hypothetical protein